MMKKSRSSRGSSSCGSSRAIVGIAVLVGSLIVSVQPGMSKPGDVMSSLSSPGVGAPAEEKRDIGAGDLDYASRTGALQYGYNFVVPPGRVNVEPSIGLSYTSQGSLRGGIASGWSMSIPMIELDSSDNAMLQMPNNTGQQGLDELVTADLPFVSSMSGGHRLVPVDGKTETGWQAYRSEYDDMYIRYERHIAKGIWRARTMDGKTWFFGTGHEGEDVSNDSDTASPDPDLHDGIPVSLIFHSEHTGTAKESPHHQPLTRVVDAFGNTVRYFWEADFPKTLGQSRFPEALRLHSIRYTENASAGIASHAKVEFYYEEPEYCSANPADKELPIGTSLNQSGFFPWYSGRQALAYVETSARSNSNSDFFRVRRVRLDTSKECPDNGGAARQLLGITLVDPEPIDASAAADLQQPITFGYGALERQFNTTNNFSISANGATSSNQSDALSWGYRQKYQVDPTLERSLLDFDGDGRLDLLETAPGDGCAFNWKRNLGNGSFGAASRIDFPDEGTHWRDGEGPGTGEGCSLSARRFLWTNRGSGDGSFTPGIAGNHVLHRFIDMNQDGRPDLVTSIEYNACLIGHNMAGAIATSSDLTAPGITSVFEEPWPSELTKVGSCSDVTVNDIETHIDNVCDLSTSDDCGCAVLDQDAVAEIARGRREPVQCNDYSEVVPGFNPDRTANGGATWTFASGSCPSYSLMRNGHYPWTVHYSVENNGEIEFDAGHRIWSPIPLDPASSQSSIASNGGKGVTSSSHAVQDITGDGIIDVVTMGAMVTPTTVNGENGRHWNVFAGIADPETGEFLGFEDSPYYWIIPRSAKISSSSGFPDVSNPEHITLISKTVSTLIDTNADGLPDLVRQRLDETGFEIAINTGRGFCVTRSGEVPNTVLSGETSVDRTGYSNITMAPGPIKACGNGSTESCTEDRPMWGIGQSFAKLVDYDGDGLPDYYNAGYGDGILRPLGCSSEICVETALTMGAGSGFRDIPSSLDQYIPREIEVGGVNNANVWWQKSDYMDLDGDGLDDLATPSTSSQYSWDLLSDDTAPGKPLRLLNSINNGQGLVTSVEYHPYNDSIAMSNRYTGKGMPSHIWVVTKIVSHSDIDSEFSPAPDSEVIVKYGDPAYTMDHHGQHGFRGFESIQSSRPHDGGTIGGFSVTEQRYDYEADWSGRLSETVTYVDGFPTDSGAFVAAISSKSWTMYSLFLGASVSYHSVGSSNRNCMDSVGVFRSEADCTLAFSSGGSSSKMTLVSDIGGIDNDLAWVPSATQSYLYFEEEEGSKRSESDVELYSNPTKYMLHTSENRSYVRADGLWILANRTTQRLDTSNTYVEYTGQSGTIDGANIMWESKATRSSVGQVVETQDPEDFGTAFKVQSEYTDLQVHALSVTNELGHEATMTMDYGTGQILQAFGANILSCSTFRREGVDTEYDKLGRVTRVLRRGCDGDVYDVSETSSVEYAEYNPSTKIPSHVVSTTVLDSALGTTSVSKTYIDGAGRTLRTEVVLGSEVAQTNSHHDSAGQLVLHQETSPSTSGSAVFTETAYSYDSLGRATAMRQDSNASAGVDLSYSFKGGVSTQTSTEIVSDGGPAGEKTTHNDHFGRLLQVDEKMDGGGYASTTYDYDFNDNIERITDAMGVVTEMYHDMSGRRRYVVRGERVWSYAYDKNGSMIRETSPNDLGESAENPVTGLYTTSTVYDALNRPTSRVLAKNDLSNKQQETYDASFVEFYYDSCSNGKGKLCAVQTGKTLATVYTYDWAGRVVEERQKIDAREAMVDFGDGNSAPDFTIARSSYYAYNSSGAVLEAWLPDGPDQSSSTHLQYEYNEFTGAPEKLSQYMGVDKYGNPTMQEIAFVTRNPAQRVISQTTGCLTRSWDYDSLGRVSSTDVQGAGCSAQNGVILSESMQYSDSSEVLVQSVYRAGLPSRKFQYQYDSQHQLISADDFDSYRVSYQYSPNGTMNAVGGIDGILLGRDPMKYSYGDGTLSGADEHAPMTLTGKAKDLHYDYDFSGNVALRTEVTDPTGKPSKSEWSFGYDGVGQQREVLLNNGSGGRELYYYDSAGQRYMAATYKRGTDTFPERIRVWMGGADIWYKPNASATAMEVDTEYAYLSLGAINIGRIKSQGPTMSTEATFANGLSHVMGSVDWDSGIVNAAYIYGPYGEIVDSIGQEQDDHLRRFNGKESDKLSKLSYYGFRYYDSQSLSWTQADPLYLFVPDVGMDDPRRMSLYTFSLNNPIRYLDPDGRDSKAENNKKKPKAKKGKKRSKKKKPKTVTIKFIWLKGHGVSKEVRKAIEQRITAKYNQIAARGVSVKVTSGKAGSNRSDIEGATKATSGVTVILGKFEHVDPVAVIERVLKTTMTRKDKNEALTRIHRQNTGFGASRGNKGVALVSTANGLTDDGMLDNFEDKAKFGAGLTEHEIGHGFGAPDSTEAGTMMDGNVSSGMGQRPPAKVDRDLIRRRLGEEAQ